MKEYYISESLKSTQGKKKGIGRGEAFLHRPLQFFTLSFIDLGNILCATDRESFSVASLSTETDLLAS